MRIGILGPVAWRIPPRKYGGWENVTYLLAEGLVKRGYDVTLFATADSVTSAKLESIVPRPLEEDSSLPPRVYETLHIVNAYEKAKNFDILHNNIGVYGTVLSKLSPIPVLTTLHGSAAEPDSRIIYARYRDHPYVSISNAERRICPELNYISTVYNGIDIASAPEPTTPEDYLLFVGRLSPDKGIHNAIKVSLATGRRLIIAGIIPKANEEYYEKEISRYIDGRNIIYIGPVDPVNRNRLMNKAYALLHLVEYEEAFGLTMAEAMATGCPVIGNNRGSVPEVVKHGETGFVVNTLNEAIEAIDKVKFIDRKKCREWVNQRFSADQMVSGYIEVYQRLLG